MRLLRLLIAIIAFLALPPSLVAATDSLAYAGKTYPGHAWHDDLYLTINPINYDIYLYEDRTGVLKRISANTGLLDTLKTDLPTWLNFETKFDGQAITFWDKGGGRVWELDLNTLEFRRLDNIYPHRNFYYHAASVMDDGRIFLFGGFGFWEWKDLLIYYNPQAREWIEIHDMGNKPEFTSQHWIYYFKEEKKFLFGQIKDGLINIYSLNEQNYEWSYVESYAGIDLRDVRHTYLYNGDVKKGLFALSANNFLNIHKRILYSMENFELHPNIHFGQQFYIEKLDIWISIGSSSFNQPQLGIEVFDPSLLDKNPNIIKNQAFQKSDPINWEASIPWLFGIFSILISIVTLYFALGYFKLRRQLSSIDAQKPNGFAKIDARTQHDLDTFNNTNSDSSDSFNDISSRPTILIQLLDSNESQNGSLQLNLGEHEYNIVDEVEITFWRAIYFSVKNGEYEMQQNDFDQKVFNGHADAPQKSRIRNRIMGIINEKAGFELISTVRNPVDKRFKLIRISKDLIVSSEVS